MEKFFKIGQVLVLKRRLDNERVTNELYQVEKFYPNFIQLRHIKGGYTETFLPHDLFKQKLLTFQQFLECMRWA
jgi:hypothetical protein